MSDLKQVKSNQDGNLTAKIINLGLIISLGNCCIGYTGGCLSSIEHILQAHNRLSDSNTMYQLSFATASLNFGAIIGALFYKKFEDYFGTLKSFKIIDILCIFFISLQLIDLNVYFLAAGRFLYGIFMTMSLAMTPNFLNKMSKIYNPSIAGTLGSFNQLLIVFGIIVSYMMAYILPKTIENGDVWTAIKWRLYLGAPIFFILIRLKAVIANPEYQVVEQILMNKKPSTTQSGASKDAILKLKEKASYKKRLIVAILVIASNQLSCINGIFFYVRQMMDIMTDGNQEMSKVLMLFLAFGQLLAAMMSGKLMNKYDGKKIFIKGQQALIVILFLCFLFDTENPFLSVGIRHICMGILINLHVIIFNLTLGPVCIYYCSEILHDLKYVVLTLKIFSLFFALTSDIMIHRFGIGVMFMIFGVISLIACIYLKDEMQQTRNLEKEKIYESFIPSNLTISTVLEPEVKPLKKVPEKGSQNAHQEKETDEKKSKQFTAKN